MQSTKVEVAVISSQPWVVFIALTLLFLVMVTTLLILQRASKKRSNRDDPDITDADTEASVDQS
jgi:UDP-N-acetylmuramyl pentapeptide phosphotransferase/UDP-N-acetylglucosamine-1-phosphate transferase